MYGLERKPVVRDYRRDDRKRKALQVIDDGLILMELQRGTVDSGSACYCADSGHSPILNGCYGKYIFTLSEVQEMCDRKGEDETKKTLQNSPRFLLQMPTEKLRICASYLRSGEPKDVTSLAWKVATRKNGNTQGFVDDELAVQRKERR